MTTRDHTLEHHNIRPTLLDRAIPIATLKPHPLNDRTRDDRAEHELQQSLQVNGQYRAIVARRLTRGRVQILAGHGTVDAAKALGWTHVAAEIHEGLDDQEAARIVAVDNHTSDLAGYDETKRAELLGFLDDLAGSGYITDELQEILGRVAALDPPARTDPDDAPAPAENPVTELGQVWLLGEHRLVVGDGTDHATVAAALGQRNADAVITDPPYNVNYTGGTGLTIDNDNMDGDAFESFLVDLFDAASSNTKPGGPAYVFHADTEGERFRRAYQTGGFLLKQCPVWVKDVMVLGRQDHHWQHEPILYGWRPGAAHQWFGGRTLTTLLDSERDPASMSKEELVGYVQGLLEETTVVRATRPKRSLEHPTMKPVALLTEALRRLGQPADRLPPARAACGAGGAGSALCGRDLPPMAGPHRRGSGARGDGR